MYQLAEFNVATLRAPIGDPSVQPFVDGLDTINRLAERAPGFVWRLADDGGKSNNFRPFGDDVLFTLSVWRDPEAIRDFVYRSSHADYLKRRKEWFVPGSRFDIVLWWIEAGRRPDPVDGMARLEHLRAQGPSDQAFHFGKLFGPPVPEAAE